MYSSFTPQYQRRIRATLATAWAFAGLGGISEIVAPPTELHLLMGDFFIGTFGFLMAAFSALSIWGVVRNSYRFEWVSSWYVATMYTPFVMTVWYLFLFEEARAAPPLFSTSLLAFFLYRGVSCGAHADKLRRESERGGSGVPGG